MVLRASSISGPSFWFDSSNSAWNQAFCLVKCVSLNLALALLIEHLFYIGMAFILASKKSLCNMIHNI